MVVQALAGAALAWTAIAATALAAPAPSLHGAATLVKWHVETGHVSVTVTTTVAGTFAIEVGGCNPQGQVARVAGRHGIALAVGESKTFDLQTIQITDVEPATGRSWYIALEATGAQQIYSSGTCLESGRKPNHASEEPHYMVLPPEMR